MLRMKGDFGVSLMLPRNTVDTTFSGNTWWHDCTLFGAWQLSVIQRHLLEGIIHLYLFLYIGLSPVLANVTIDPLWGLWLARKKRLSAAAQWCFDTHRQITAMLTHSQKPGVSQWEKTVSVVSVDPFVCKITCQGFINNFWYIIGCLIHAYNCLQMFMDK